MIVSQKNQELSMQVDIVNNCSIPSKHAKRKIADLSDQHFFTPCPSLSPY
jgi:hypothetical protein